MIVCIIYTSSKWTSYNRIPHPTQAHEWNLNVDRYLNLRKSSYDLFNRKMGLGGVLSNSEI